MSEKILKNENNWIYNKFKGIAICQEIFYNWDLPKICNYIKEIGYKGIELAPFKLSSDLRKTNKEKWIIWRKIIQEFDLKVNAMHWLLANTEDLHITTPNKKKYIQTKKYFKNYLIELARTLNVETLVFGSPKQRNIEKDWDFNLAYQQGINFFREVGDFANRYGIKIGIEPLGKQITNFAATTEETIRIIKEIDHSNIFLHLDSSAMLREEKYINGKNWKEQLNSVKKYGVEILSSIHLNDPNGLGPGMGNFDFSIFLKKLSDIGYNSWVSIETFDTNYAPTEIAEKSINYLKMINF